MFKTHLRKKTTNLKKFYKRLQKFSSPIVKKRKKFQFFLNTNCLFIRSNSKSHLKKVDCKSVCVGDRCAGFERECQKCKYFSLMPADNANEEVKCVSYCPTGYYADFAHKRCAKCHSSCAECKGPSSTECLRCKGDLLQIDNAECASQCPTGHFQSRLNKKL